MWKLCYSYGLRAADFGWQASILENVVRYTSLSLVSPHSLSLKKLMQDNCVRIISGTVSAFKNESCIVGQDATSVEARVKVLL